MIPNVSKYTSPMDPKDNVIIVGWLVWIPWDSENAVSTEVYISPYMSQGLNSLYWGWSFNL